MKALESPYSCFIHRIRGWRRAQLCVVWIFVEVLRQLRPEMGFLLIGLLLMPDHFHLLIKPEPAESTSRWRLAQSAALRCSGPTHSFRALRE